MNDAIVHLTIGSSPLMTAIPTALLVRAWRSKTPEERAGLRVSLGEVLVGLPLAYGVVCALAYWLLGAIPRKVQGSYVRFYVTAGLSAAVVSLAAESLFGLHSEWLQVEDPFLVHAGVGLFFVAMYYSVGQWLRHHLLYGPPNAKAPSCPTPPAPPPPRPPDPGPGPKGKEGRPP